MKKLVCFLLAMLMLLSTFTACGNKMPKFDENELTTAQQYVQAIMKQYEIRRGKEFKAARVLIAEDMKAFLNDAIGLKQWDASEASALVLIYIGNVTDTSAPIGDANSDGKDKDKQTVEYNAFNPDPSWLWMYYVVDAENKIVYKWLADEVVSSAANSGGTRQDKLPSEIAKAELDMESYATQYASVLGDYVTEIEQRIKDDKNYLYSAKLWEDVLGDSYKTAYAQKRKEVQSLRDEMEYYKTDTSGLAQSNWNTLKSYKNQKFDLQKNLATVRSKLAALEQNNAQAISEFLTKTEDMRKQSDYLFNIDYARLVITNDIYNNYDNYTRQIWVYETSIAALDKAMAEEDNSARKYILNRSTKETDTFSAASNAFKVHAQCLNNQEQFKFANTDAIAAYEAASKAAKDKAGANYEKDVDYLKVEMTYQSLTKQLKAHESAVTNSKADYDKKQTEGKTAIEKMDTDEQERLIGVAISKDKYNSYEWTLKQTEYMDEYQAKDGQWGALHPDYAEYQNQHLKYYTSNSGGSSFGCVYIYDDGRVCRRTCVKGKIYCSTHL